MASPQFIDNFSHSFKCANACSKGERVVLDNVSGEVDAAAATDKRLGVAARDIAAGEFGEIRFVTAPSGIYKTNVAIAVGDKVYGAASGLVGTTNTNEPIGIAVTSSTGSSGELLTVVHQPDI